MSISSIYAQDFLVRIADQVRSQRQRFESLNLEILRRNLFSNRLEFHPRHLREIASGEVDAVIRFLTVPDYDGTIRGKELCHAGLSKQTITGLCAVNNDFFQSFDGGPHLQLIVAQYRTELLDGFHDAREMMILSEQDDIQKAFQIALNKSFNETVSAQLQTQKLIEEGYQNVIFAQEEERRRISRELHDQAGQALIGVRLSLEGLVGSQNRQSKPSGAQVQNIIKAVDQVIQDVRSIAYSLRPPMLDILGLGLAIKQLCYDISDQSNLIVDYDGCDIESLPDNMAISIYRFVQECLTNVIKHADAKHAWVKLCQDEEGILLEVTDDGRGFDPDAVRRGVGLTGMFERIQLLNGNLSIESQSDGLTIFRFQIPFQPV